MEGGSEGGMGGEKEVRCANYHAYTGLSPPLVAVSSRYWPLFTACGGLKPIPARPHRRLVVGGMPSHHDGCLWRLVAGSLAA